MKLPAIFRNALQRHKEKNLPALPDGPDTVLALGQEVEGDRLGPWRNGRIRKQFSVETIGGMMDPCWTPPPETKELARGWYIDDDGFYTCSFPAVETHKKDFQAAEHHAYPAHLTAARMSGATSSTRFQMAADKVAMKFHHWMGQHIPGFWDVYNYKRDDHNKSFRLRFEGQGEIVFYATHGGYWGDHVRTDEQGALMVVKTEDGQTFRLLYESNVADPHRAVCYPGEQEEKHVAFNVPPDGKIADNIITAFAIVRAVGRLRKDADLKALPVPDDSVDILHLDRIGRDGDILPPPHKLRSLDL